MRAAALIAALVLLCGCQSAQQCNPSYQISRADAKAALAEMRDEPQPLERPLVILSGYLEPGLGAGWMGVKVRKLVDDDRVLTIGYSFAGDMDAARATVVKAVNKAYPSDDPSLTVPVDVIGISMGGLIGRFAAMPVRDDPEAPRLNVVRLFTLSSPHRGARLARLPIPHKLRRKMHVDSEFIAWINEADAERSYEVIPYVRLGDTTVGPENAAPEGQTPWWQPTPSFGSSHAGGTFDERFIADIMRRLRGEPTFTNPPPAPLPDEPE